MENYKGYDAYSIYHTGKLGTVIESNHSHTKIQKPSGEIIELPNHIIVLDPPKTEKEIECSGEQAHLDDEFEADHPPFDAD